MEKTSKPFDETTAKHKVVIYGHPALRKRAEEISVFDDELRSLAREMFATMTDYEGIGLAATQINRNVRLLVVGIMEDENDDVFYMAVCNPVIIDSSGTFDMEEGCLSIPDIRDTVTRPEEITLEYDTLEGEHRKIKTSGILARVLQHEIDHLNGVLFVDHLSPIRRGLLSGKLKRLEREQLES